ncbi:haloacid dehalogenase [Chromatium weissei]|nr:haloacid dehalogenase [Chromatium weissei]
MNVNWKEINNVFLDLDGTLLDLHFDNHFWLEHVPLRYSEKHGLSMAEAKAELFSRYRAIEGTLEWYCVEHWSRELDLNIIQLKREVAHLIAIHPYTIDFLEAVMTLGKRVVLVTNAHQKSLELKLERTMLEGYFDRIVSAHELKVAKEAPLFWSSFQAIEPFDPKFTLFVDDNLSVLRQAQAFGIHWLVIAMTPDSTVERRRINHDFLEINDFSELLPVS